MQLYACVNMLTYIFVYATCVFMYISYLYIYVHMYACTYMHTSTSLIVCNAIQRVLLYACVRMHYTFVHLYTQIHT